MDTPTVSVALLGDYGVGKTALTIQMVIGIFENDCDPTIEDIYRIVFTKDDITIVLQILDTAGGDLPMRIPSIIRNYTLFFCVYSVTSRYSFDYIMKEIARILELKEKQPYFIILVGNKSDLEFDRQISFEEGLHSANEINVLFAETSAKDRQSVHDAFSKLILHANLSNFGIESKKEEKIK